MLIRLLSVDEVMWCRQQSVNHQELLCSLHCATTVVLREQLNFKSAVIRSERSSCFFNRAAIGRRGSRFTRCFFFFFGRRVERHILPLGHIVSWTSNHATYDLSSPKVVETVIHGQCYGHCFLYCV